MRAADDDVKFYVKGTACRRTALFKHFEGTLENTTSGHHCCDICAKTCKCNDQVCAVSLLLPVGKAAKNGDSGNMHQAVRDVTDDQASIEK